MKGYLKNEFVKKTNVQKEKTFVQKFSPTPWNIWFSEKQKPQLEKKTPNKG